MFVHLLYMGKHFCGFLNISKMCAQSHKKVDSTPPTIYLSQSDTVIALSICGKLQPQPIKSFYNKDRDILKCIFSRQSL